MMCVKLFMDLEPSFSKISIDESDGNEEKGAIISYQSISIKAGRNDGSMFQ